MKGMITTHFVHMIFKLSIVFLIVHYYTNKFLHTLGDIKKKCKKSLLDSIQVAATHTPGN